ncbi:MAG TPA: Gfo/Idh/MocA family oxidoreductase, partial [Lacipirellulaceae bacterium]|nr:Gfo/Idh/MocA family oxidoreductase [Lacipirellulaceae bacterium]
MKHLLTWLAVAAALHAAPALGDEPRRVGIIGCDTSHVVAFTDLINAPDADDARAGFRVTAAFPGGSDDLPDSYERVAGYVDELRKRDVEIIESIDELVDRVDAILLESVDGRPHLAQFRAAARGKPVFIDKPLAASLADALAIFAIADATNTPCFSASGVRFTEQTTSLATDPALGPLLGAETASPYKTEPHHPDWFWYGIHAVEPLVALL